MIEFINSGLRRFAVSKISMMLGRNQARVDCHPTLANSEIMKSAAECRPSHLEDAETPALRSVLNRDLLHPHDAMADRMQIKIVALRGQVIQQQDRAGVLGEIVLECQHLAR